MASQTGSADLLIKQGITITTSLMYSSVIALAAPRGPIIGLVIGDRFERKIAGAMLIVMLAIGLPDGAEDKGLELEKI